MQYSFGIIKPDAMQKKYYGKILDDIASAGYKLIGLKLFHLTEEKAKNFYAKHENKPFFVGAQFFCKNNCTIYYITYNSLRDIFQEFFYRSKLHTENKHFTSLL